MIYSRFRGSFILLGVKKFHLVLNPTYFYLRRSRVPPFAKDCGIKLVLESENVSHSVIAIWRLWHPKVLNFSHGSIVGTPFPLRDPKGKVSFVKMKQKPNMLPQVKNSNWNILRKEITKFYYGCQLLYLNIKVCRQLLKQQRKLTRREKKLLIRTVGDIFKRTPLTLYAVPPFLEYCLPFLIAYCPRWIPSRFECHCRKDNELEKTFKVKLEVAKFLQDILESMKPKTKGTCSQDMIKLSGNFVKGSFHSINATPEQLIQFCKIFRDDVVLSVLPKSQILALCKHFKIKIFGSTAYLRYLLELKLRKLRVDDKLINIEGVNSLNRIELEAACESRGIPILGHSDAKMRHHLTKWVELSVKQKIPTSLILLSQAYLFVSQVPKQTPVEKHLEKVISELPKEMVTAANTDVQNCSGETDYKTECHYIRNEIHKIKEEVAEFQRIKGIRPKEIRSILVKILCKNMRLEKGELALLKKKMECFEEDEICSKTKKKYLFKPVVSSHLKNILKKILYKLTEALSTLESRKTEKGSSCSTFLKTSECRQMLREMRHVSASTKEKISKICRSLTDDEEDEVPVERLIKVMEIIEHFEEIPTSKQLDEIMDLIEKEELTENDFQLMGLMRADDGLRKNWRKCL